MKLGSAHGFVNHFLVGALLTIGFGGSVGLGTVWLRHQISVVADANRDLEQRRHDVERRIDDVTAQVESALSPDVLRSENQLMQLGLVELTQSQITPVAVDPIARLAVRANRRVFERDGVRSGISIQLNLAAGEAAANASANTAPTAKTSPLGTAGSTFNPAGATFNPSGSTLNSRHRGALATNP